MSYKASKLFYIVAISAAFCLASCQKNTSSTSSSTPTASFSYVTTNFTASFTDTSLSEPKQWSWNFGDGTSSTLQNPTHSYSANGNYTVTLVVTNSIGNSTASQSLPILNTTLNIHNFLDASGNGNDLALGGRGAPSFLANPWGTGVGGMVFDGNKLLASPNYSLPSGNWTIEIRLSRNTTNNGTIQAVAGKWDGVAGYQWLLYFDASNKLNFVANDSSNANHTITSASSVVDGNPHAIAVVNNGGTMTLYVDGVSVGTAALPSLISSSATFMIGDYDDTTNTTGGLPYYGTLGEFRLSNSARYTSSYSVATNPLSSDGSTLALVEMGAIVGTFLGSPSFNQNILLRTGFPQASGGWANPDGPREAIGGGMYFTTSAYNGAEWVVYAAVASSLEDILKGNAQIQPTAIQTPAADEGDLAGNGAVFPIGEMYYHLYQTDPGNAVPLKISSGASLNSAFPEGTLLWNSGAAPFASYNAVFDPYAVTLPNGNIKIYFGTQDNNGNRYGWTSTYSAGNIFNVLNWSSPTEIIFNLSGPGYPVFEGEPSTTTPGTNGSAWLYFDGAETTTSGRRINRRGTFDGVTYFSLGKLLDPSGADANGITYSGCYDSSPYFDWANNRLIMIGTHSTNAQQAQPTNSDIGSWFIPILNQ